MNRDLRRTLVWGCLLMAAVGCSTDDEEATRTADNCVFPLDSYCVGGDPPDAECPPKGKPSNVIPCGPYEVTPTRADTSTVAHYFLDGEHVATVWGSDIDEFCGGSYSMWFGEIIDCEPEYPDTGAY